MVIKKPLNMNVEYVIGVVISVVKSMSITEKLNHLMISPKDVMISPKDLIIY